MWLVNRASVSASTAGGTSVSSSIASENSAGVRFSNPASSIDFFPEKARTYEVGIKADSFDRRLRTNATLFYTDYNDFQVAQFTGGNGTTTNADATSKALASYDDIYWIAGGKPKDGGLDGLDEYMPRVRHAFLIGEAMEDFAGWLQKRGVAITKSKTLEQAVNDAHALAKSGVVLLSPACASFDQFKNFEDRGDQFAAFVRKLA